MPRKGTWLERKTRDVSGNETQEDGEDRRAPHESFVSVNDFEVTTNRACGVTWARREGTKTDRVTERSRTSIRLVLIAGKT